jgi:hypothetical protein
VRCDRAPSVAIPAVANSRLARSFPWTAKGGPQAQPQATEIVSRGSTVTDAVQTIRRLRGAPQASGRRCVVEM